MIIGHQPNKALDAVFINSPLKDYDHSPRRNDFTLPVLGLGYLATSASKAGFNVGVLDSEALGLGVSQITKIINDAKPRWIGLNLLAPTYKNSVKILQRISPDIHVMVGGHQAKAMPIEILSDKHIPRIDAMVLGEGESRVERLLLDTKERERLPNVLWRSSSNGPQQGRAASPEEKSRFLAPDVDQLPFVDRKFFAQDPFMAKDGRMEANLVGSRGCPYDCSFCGAAKSVSHDISVRTRSPANILAEMDHLANTQAVSAFRFVDDLFLARANFMRRCLRSFIEAGVTDKWVWDATGRINVLANADNSLLNLIKEGGCREVALGIESGSNRILDHINKYISPEMTIKAVKSMTTRGIHVKGYFILGFPTETEADMAATVDLLQHLWDCTASDSGRFRCSVFEFRPYPGTTEWSRLLTTGRYSPEQLLNYEHVNLPDSGQKPILLERDEFNFSVNIQFGEVPVQRVRAEVARLMSMQKEKLN
jgi:anaerobic magnesium-protoporphyrin IX monomethyl ester cyclase